MQPKIIPAREIADLVARRLKIPGVSVSVHPHDTLGWTATVVTRLGATTFAQQQVEEIVADLRGQYTLRAD